jgi:hypothetical protein
MWEKESAKRRALRSAFTSRSRPSGLETVIQIRLKTAGSDALWQAMLVKLKLRRLVGSRLSAICCRSSSGKVDRGMLAAVKRVNCLGDRDDIEVTCASPDLKREERSLVKNTDLVLVEALQEPKIYGWKRDWQVFLYLELVEGTRLDERWPGLKSSE